MCNVKLLWTISITWQLATFDFRYELRGREICSSKFVAREVCIADRVTNPNPNPNQYSKSYTNPIPFPNPHLAEKCYR